MKTSSALLIILSMLLIIACGPNSGSNSQSKQDPFADLTYADIMDTVFGQSDGTGIEWHEEALDESASGDISFQEAGPCGENDCGKLIQVKNTAVKPVEIVVQSLFSIPDFPPYTAIKMTVPAQGTAVLGCSHLCLADTKVQFSPKLVGATYVEE